MVDLRVSAGTSLPTSLELALYGSGIEYILPAVGFKCSSPYLYYAGFKEMITSPAGLGVPMELVPRLDCSPLYPQLLAWARPQARPKRPLTMCEPRCALPALGL